jgi:hypothetical protein
MAMPRGHLLDISFGLGLWSSLCAKKTLRSCTKTNRQRNHSNGDSWLWNMVFLTIIHALYIDNKSPVNEMAMPHFQEYKFGEGFGLQFVQSRPSKVEQKQNCHQNYTNGVYIVGCRR